MPSKSPTDLTLTVYSLPGCVQCNATYRSLDKKNLTYTVADAADGPNNELIIGLGYMQAPVTILRHGESIIDHWSGFRPDKIGEMDAIFNPVQELAAASA